ASLNFAPGTSISIAAHQIDSAGKISAPGGTIDIALSAPMPDAFLPAFADIPRNRFVLESGAVLDVSGQWVNDSNTTRDTLTGSTYMNGGSISIVAAPDEQHALTPSANFADVILRPGSAINVSGGGYVTSAGQLALDANRVPIGRGGSLSIALHAPSGAL